MPGDPHPVFVDDVAVQKSNARAYLQLRLGNADALRALDGSSFWFVYIASLQSEFARDAADTTTADDDATVIVDANGGRWKIQNPDVSIVRSQLGLGTGDSPTFTGVTLSGGQLVFPGTQNPSANANTLDDYEEGTWTPAFSAAGATFNHALQAGFYTKIGNVCMVSFAITLAGSGNTLTAAALTITGLPFQMKTASGLAVMRFALTYFNAATNYVGAYVGASPGTSSLEITGNTAASATTQGALNADALLHATNGTGLRSAIFYYTD